MASTQSVNAEIVINFLRSVGDASKGASVQDIVAGTGLSKSTVHRIIRKVDPIQQNAVFGRAVPTYYIDYARLENWDPSEVFLGEHKRRLLKFKRFDEKRRQVVNTTDMWVGIRYLFKDFAYQDHILALGVLFNKSILRQNGLDVMEPSDVASGRLAIESLHSWAIDLALFTEKLLNDPAFNTEDIWKAFPIEKAKVPPELVAEWSRSYGNSH